MKINKIVLLAVAVFIVGIAMLFSAYELYAEKHTGLAWIRALFGISFIVVSRVIAKRS